MSECTDLDAEGGAEIEGVVAASKAVSTQDSKGTRKKFAKKAAQGLVCAGAVYQTCISLGIMVCQSILVVNRCILLTMSILSAIRDARRLLESRCGQISRGRPPLMTSMHLYV